MKTSLLSLVLLSGSVTRDAARMRVFGGAKPGRGRGLNTMRSSYVKRSIGEEEAVVRADVRQQLYSFTGKARRSCRTACRNRASFSTRAMRR